MRILIATAVHRKLPLVLQQSCLALAHRVIASDRNHDFGLWMDFRDCPEVPRLSPWSRICRVADRALEAVELMLWDYVLWVDADVVDYPHDICTRLLSVNNGITAPLPLIEGSARLYDTAACIQDGGDTIHPGRAGNIPGRNLRHEPPYWDHQPSERFVEMDCVGMCLLVPGWLFAKVGVPDHPAFTGWHGVCKTARDHGVKVGIDRETIAYHAELPKYGLNWH